MHLSGIHPGQIPNGQQPRPPVFRHVLRSCGGWVKHIGELRHHQVFQALIGRQGLAGLGQLGGQVRCGDGHSRVWIGDVVLELLGTVHGVDGNHHRVDPQNRKVGDHPLRAVLHVQNHTITRLHAQLAQLTGQLLGTGLELLVGPDPTHEDQCGFIWIAQGTDGQIHPQGRGGGRDLGGQARRPDSSMSGHQKSPLLLSC